MIPRRRLTEGRQLLDPAVESGSQPAALIDTSLGPSVVPRRAVWAVAAATAIGVGFSRVHRGLHHPTDVVAGALLGLGCLLVAVVVTRLLTPSKIGGAP